MKFRILILLLLAASTTFAQEDITTQLFETYDKYKETSLDKRRIKHHELQPLLAKYKANPKFTIKVVGKSIEGRDLSLVSIGQGKNLGVRLRKTDCSHLANVVFVNFPQSGCECGCYTQDARFPKYFFPNGFL